MAVYKVPQDVEADDKLIGPFSFRQFIYLIIVAISIALAWGLAQLSIVLVVIPLPIIIFFGALALPLKKDQPMEVYLAAIVSFHLRPKKRLWQPDGLQELVEIVAPRTKEISRTKDLSQNEAERRLSYLAQIADTHGWAVRGVAAMPTQNTAMRDDLYFEAQQTNDILDSTSTLGQNFDSQLAGVEAQRREAVIAQMQQKTPTPASPPIISHIQTPIGQPTSLKPAADALNQALAYATSKTATPTSQSPTSTSEKELSPDIISLASNPDLSIETIAHEAQRIQKREAEQEEVVISLR